ncbi:hypothetical protein DPX16_12062 [Anabarilius grahami]|uniref:Uncharacterized protein n=1 Tax=Anabarilius grahami TaxID=495550 RepID=A0A3N0YYW3_ANAGA|nr:hypothetical protein DPX16_12062 [Anabarilius grahami]
MCVREEVALVTENLSAHTRKSGSTGKPSPTVTHEREGVKTVSKQNGCIPTESKQLIIYADTGSFSGQKAPGSQWRSRALISDLKRLQTGSNKCLLENGARSALAAQHTTGTTSHSPKDLQTTSTVFFPDVINPPSVHTHLIIIIMTQANFLPAPSLSATFTSLSITFSSGPPSYTVVTVTHADSQHTVEGNVLREKEEQKSSSL